MRALLLVLALLCMQATPVQATANFPLQYTPSAALVTLLVALQQSSTSSDFDLFHGSTPQNVCAKICAITIFMFLVYEIYDAYQQSGQASGARFLLTLLGLLPFCVPAFSGRFIIPFTAFLIIALQRTLTTPHAANN